MALPKIAEVRGLKDEEVAEQIIAVKRDLFELRLQKATSRLEKTHEVKHKKHRLAQLLTIEGERRRSAAAAQAASPKEEPEQPASAAEVPPQEKTTVAEEVVEEAPLVAAATENADATS